MRVLYAAGLGVWVAAVAAGLVQLWAYENAPGAAALAPADWPADSTLPRPRRATLVVLMHPQCSCSQATAAELARLHAGGGAGLDTYVLMLAPVGAARAWVDSPLRRTAAAIRGVTVVDDDNGVEARRFGAMTSGQALLYDAHGHLQFSGGITGSRGHQGDNAGRSAIERLVRGQPADSFTTLVFGCPLFGPAAAGKQEQPGH